MERFNETFKAILYMGFRATLNFRKLKVALNRMYRISLNFAKSCISFCLSKFHNKKKFHLAKIIPTCSPVIGQFFDNIIVASIDKGGDNATSKSKSWNVLE